jgi:hypothetical protein
VAAERRPLPWLNRWPGLLWSRRVFSPLRPGGSMSGSAATLLKEESTERHRREVLEKARVLHHEKVRHQRDKAGCGRLACRDAVGHSAVHGAGGARRAPAGRHHGTISSMNSSTAIRQVAPVTSFQQPCYKFTATCTGTRQHQLQQAFHRGCDLCTV